MNLQYKMSTLAIVINSILYSTGFAGVTTDGSMGAQQNFTGNSIQIDSNLGSVNGGNLFHSFSEFTINETQTVTFTGPNNINNIISRVTGESSSVINGTIRSDIAGANFFLLNPNGILFGQNAKIDISGSFYASTADYLKFGENSLMFVDKNQNITFSTNPEAFGFIDNEIGDIKIDGSSLNNQNVAGYSFTGGNISVINNAEISSADGIIQLASTLSNGEINADLEQTNLANFAELGTININGNSTIDTSGDASGRIVIRGGNLVLNDSTVKSNTTAGTAINENKGIDLELTNAIVLSDNASIQANVEIGSMGDSGGVTASADTIDIGNNSSILSQTENSDFLPSFGNSGPINISANNLLIHDHSTVATKTKGAGKAGNIDIVLQGKLELKNISTIDSSTVTPDRGGMFIGSPGDVTIKATNVEITGDANAENPALNDLTGIDTTAGFSIDRGGDVSIETNYFLLKDNGTIQSNTFSTERSGNITIAAGEGDIDILNGGTISTSTNIQGNAGDITLKGKNITIAGAIPGILTHKSFVGSSSTTSSGTGNITIEGEQIAILDGGIVSTVSASFGGKSGDISLDAKKVIINGYNQEVFDFKVSEGQSKETAMAIAASTITTNSSFIDFGFGLIPQGTGDISITANDVTIENNARISTELTGDATNSDTGNINITSNVLRITNNASITTNSDFSFGSNGGSININNNGLFYMSNSKLATDVVFGEGNGGNINLTSNRAILDSSSITTTADEGLGGDIAINAHSLGISQDTIIDASSEKSIDGLINIISKKTIPHDLEKLPERIATSKELFKSRCNANSADNSSSFYTNNNQLNRITSDFLFSLYNPYDLNGNVNQLSTAALPEQSNLYASVFDYSFFQLNNINCN